MINFLPIDELNSQYIDFYFYFNNMIRNVESANLVKNRQSAKNKKKFIP
ncbi:hypothetical protein AGMMS50239_15670 [Bacteroidia bacterium]|nr:hypothetical protein AGMMS50239_15670 [Bacteroidia bacterium]